MKHSNHSKRKGKTAAVIGIVLAILLVQRCCFHFLVYPHTYDKYAQGEDLNFYEVANVYMEYIDIELLGLIVSPQTSKLMFVKQFHLPLKYRDVPAKWDNNENVRKTILSLQPGQTKKIVWKDYIAQLDLQSIVKRWRDNDVALALNGSRIKCLARTKSTITIEWTVLTDFASRGNTVVMGIRAPETLFDYLEKKNIISTPEATIVKTYNIAEL